MFESNVKMLAEALRKERAEERTKGREEGREEGLRESLVRILTRRFEAVPPEMLSRISEIESIQRLEQLIDISLDCPTLEEFQERLR